MTNQTRQPHLLVPWVNSGSLRSLLYLVRLQWLPLIHSSLVLLQSLPLLNLQSLVLLQFHQLLGLFNLPMPYLCINRSWLSKAEATEERENATRYPLYTKLLRLDPLVGLGDLAPSIPLPCTTPATLRSLLHQWRHLQTYHLRNGLSTLLRI